MIEGLPLVPIRGNPLTEESTFDELIGRVRAGDQDAATDLVRLYEPEIRRAVRYRLADARLGTLLDSMDLCQSVMKSFFVRAAAGQYELKTPQQLLALLATMARNKLLSQARKQQAQRRDHRRATSVGLDDAQLVDPGASPISEVAARDLLHEVRQRLAPEERRLMDLRNQGHGWAAIAAQLGGSADSARVRLSRALDRVALQLGLDEGP
jgi:RNA polymerase sigma-70 factor (ECF subfamily)